MGTTFPAARSRRCRTSRTRNSASSPRPSSIARAAALTISASVVSNGGVPATKGRERESLRASSGPLLDAAAEITPSARVRVPSTPQFLSDCDSLRGLDQETWSNVQSSASVPRLRARLCRFEQSRGKRREHVAESRSDRLGFEDAPEGCRVVGVARASLDRLWCIAADREPGDAGGSEVVERYESIT